MTRTAILSASVALVFSVLTARPAGAQQPASDTLSLTLADAVQRALANNAELAIVRLDTGVEAARVGESRGAYVPLFTTAAGRTRNVTPPSSALLGDAGVAVNDWFSSTGV